jgi:hypothetical protein
MWGGRAACCALTVLLVMLLLGTGQLDQQGQAALDQHPV